MSKKPNPSCETVPDTFIMKGDSSSAFGTPGKIVLSMAVPDPCWECGSGSMETDQNQHINLVSRVNLFSDLLSNLSISSCKNPTATLKSDQNLDPHRFDSLDPDTH